MTAPPRTPEAEHPGGWIVWVPGPRGPEPQKWPDMLVLPNGRPRPHLAAVAVSPAVYALPLSVIEELPGLRPPALESAGGAS